MKRDFHTFTNSENRTNFCSNHYFLFKNSVKLHEDLESLSNSFKMLNFLYAQPENFKKISSHLQKMGKMSNNHNEIPSYFDEIDKKIKEIKYQNEEIVNNEGKNIIENTEKNNENIEIKEKNTEADEIKRKTEKLQNILRTGNISFDGDVTLIEDKTPMVNNNNFQNNLILENIDNVAFWEDWVYFHIYS